MSNMQQFIDCRVNGESLKIAYTDTLNKHLPVMLLLHGNSSAKETFIQQVAYFNKGYRVIAPDLPGHGSSSPLLEQKYSLRTLSDFVLSFVSTLDIKLNVLAGHSLGGHLGLQVLNTLNPEQFFLWGTPPISNPPNFESIFTGNPLANLFFQNEVSLEEHGSLYKELFQNRSSAQFVNFSKNFENTASSFREDLISEFSKLEYKDEPLELKKYCGQVMFLLASHEKIINNEYVSGSFSSYPINIIEKSNHFSHEENCDMFNFTILKFLQKNTLLGRQNIELKESHGIN